MAGKKADVEGERRGRGTRSERTAVKSRACPSIVSTDEFFYVRSNDFFLSLDATMRRLRRAVREKSHCVKKFHWTKELYTGRRLFFSPSLSLSPLFSFRFLAKSNSRSRDIANLIESSRSEGSGDGRFASARSRRRDRKFLPFSTWIAKGKRRQRNCRS